ncbi:MAG: MFS transporter [Planctomycetota bacterium]
MALIREDRHDGLPNLNGTSWRSYFKGLAGILFRRRDFRAFMVACLLVTLPLTVMLTFFTRYGLTYPGVEEGVAGTFTMFYFGALAVGSLAGGLISDKLGPIAPFRIFPAFSILAVAVAVISRHPLVVSAAWSLAGLAFGVRMVIMLPAVFGFSGPYRRPSYMAVSFTVIALANALVPPLLGLMIDAELLGYEQVFLIFGAVSILGWLLFLRMPTPEPLPAAPPERLRPRPRG